MIDALRVVKSAVVDLYDNLVPLVLANLIWFVCCVPLLVLGYGLGSGMLILTAFLLMWVPNPLAGGMHVLARHAATGGAVSLGQFWPGLRAHFLRGLALFAINLGLIFLLVNSATFYLGEESLPLRMLGWAFVYGILLWVSVQFYLFPLLVYQSDKRLRMIFRSALFVSLRYWLFTLTLMAICLAIIAVGLLSVVMVPVLLMALLSVIQSRALALVIDRERIPVRRRR